MIEGNILSIDYGRNIGFAYYNTTARVIVPLAGYYTRSNKYAVLQTLDYINAKSVQVTIIGWPILLNGDKGVQCQRTQFFIDLLTMNWSGRIIKWNEQFSSRIALSRYKSDSHSLAAFIILENYVSSTQFSDHNEQFDHHDASPR